MRSGSMFKRTGGAGPITLALLAVLVLSLLTPGVRRVRKNVAGRAGFGNAGGRRVLRDSGQSGDRMMTATAKKTDPALWDKVKHEVTEGDRGGKPGQWSARKAQLAVHDYKAAGGDYVGPKAEDNHLHQWTEEHWGTKSGKPSGETGERYLPEATRENLTDKEYDATTAKKRADTKKGKQFSAQPKEIARKTAKDRDNASSLAGLTRKDLLDRAAAAKVSGRSRMSKEQLIAALTT